MTKERCTCMSGFSSGNDLCVICSNEISLVNKYLARFPNSTISDAYMNTGVSKKRIIKFIKWGKINIEAMNALYPCEFCGEPISTGRVCSNCKKKLHHELKIISSSKERTKNTIKNSFLQVKKSKEGPTSSTRGSLASEFIMGLREKRGGYF